MQRLYSVIGCLHFERLQLNESFIFGKEDRQSGSILITLYLVVSLQLMYVVDVSLADVVKNRLQFVIQQTSRVVPGAVHYLILLTLNE